MDADKLETEPPGDEAGSLESWLQLRHAQGIGTTAIRQLLDAFGDLDSALQASRSQLAKLKFTQKQVEAIQNSRQQDIQADVNWADQENHYIIVQTDARYPRILKSLDDAPSVLYVRGDPDYLGQPQLAMVGSRNPSAAGRSNAREFARHLANAGITITSGLASGVDGASHQGALDGLAGTVAVLAHGLDIVYPAQHQRLAQKIETNGALVSEMPIGTEPKPGLFPKRNRIISALSLGTLVVEAALKSGSLITARCALEQNKDVFAIPGSIHNPMARGCHQLIRQGAKLVETADDILEEICHLLPSNQVYPKRTGQISRESTNQITKILDPDHQKLLKCLAYEPSSIDELVQRSQFSAAEVASMLLILELEGVVSCHNGLYANLC